MCVNLYLFSFKVYMDARILAKFWLKIWPLREGKRPNTVGYNLQYIKYGLNGMASDLRHLYISVR